MRAGRCAEARPSLAREVRRARTHDDGRVPPGRHLDRVAPECPDEHRVPIGLVVLLVLPRPPDSNAYQLVDLLTCYVAITDCANLLQKAP
jgi:hypothetical protein